MPGTDFVVLKFGGTSVASTLGWDTIQERVESLLSRHRVWIVVSALSQVREARAEFDASCKRRPLRETRKAHRIRAGDQQFRACVELHCGWQRLGWLGFLPHHPHET